MSTNKTNSYGGKTQKEKIREITDQLEAGVSAVFESSNYKAFLECCAKFHNYSLNNCLLIMLQCPEASRVAGYVDWQRKFDRHVKKGAKGIKILAPYRYKVPIKGEGKDTKELKDSLERIRSASDAMITGIEKAFERQAKREHARAIRDEAR